MTDRRELILARLVAIAAAVPGVKLAARNKLQANDGNLPAIIVSDGDERANEADPDNRPSNAPRRITLSPDIGIMLGDNPEDVGTTINGMRAALVKSICTDATLIGLVLDRIGIRYLGCGVSFGLGRTQEGTMAVNFEFTYALRPDEL